MNSNHDNIKESLLKQRLLDYRFSEQKIKNLEYQINHFDDLKKSIGAFYLKKDNNDLTNEEIVKKIKENRDREEREKELIEINLRYLTKIERGVIEEYYFQIEKPTWEEVGCKLHISPSWAKNTRNRAIKKLIKLLY